MFVDNVKIQIKGGRGGDGCVSFYRAKYITSGGPDGGDGGRGGDVTFLADESMATLMDFRYKRKFAAQEGAKGGGRNCSGKDGESIVVKVPVGTVIREAASQRVMADLVAHGQSAVLIKGGRGGRGNQHFATPRRQAPRYAEAGKESKVYDITLELKLIADVGIIGLPNVGKSSLLRTATNANPKIADYHFTTLAPNLGVVRSRLGNDFVMADIPGLIEGASEGAGLGHAFLRHIERTRLLVHVVDAACVEGGDPIENIKLINSELEAHSANILALPQVIAANKMDITGAEEGLERLRAEFGDIFPISAATGEGVNELISYVSQLVSQQPKMEPLVPDFFEYEAGLELGHDNEPFTVEIVDEGVYSVEGLGIERMLGFTSIDTEKGFAFFQRYIKEKGINTKLEEMGIQEGDTVKLYNLEFEYYK
ncbi:MAG: GTPase ObgE [Defluviitaleaceae bacterium]|nr:GTPase ObgE [Defluviitaleaceae bacterium]